MRSYGFTWLVPAALALAVPAPAWACQQLTMVFFWNGSSEINAHGRESLDGLAAYLSQRAGEVREILIAGHSDRTGPASARRRIALERAAAVRNYLQARGVLPSLLRIEGASDSRPMVETADGVREPQNRRAEIALSYTPDALAEMSRQREADAAAGRPPPLC